MEQTRRKSVDLGRERCPFCHDDVPREQAVACQDCLARHHPACWDESARCATCGGLDRLEPKGHPALTHERVRRLLVESGYPTAEIDAVLSPASSRAPSTGPRAAPVLSPFRAELTPHGLVLRWKHLRLPWLARLLSVALLPLLLIQPWVWSKNEGTLVLGDRHLQVNGLFRNLAAVGWRHARRYDRDALRCETSPGGRALLLADGDEVLYLLGSMGLTTGMCSAVADWLHDLIQAWRRDELEDWYPHLGLK